MLFNKNLAMVFLFIFMQSSFAQEKKSIAVLELEAGGISPYEAQVLTNRLRTELFKTDKFTVLERDKMDEILIEQGFQLTGCTTNECVVEAGKLIGVQQMVAGNIAKIDNLFTIDVRLIDVETGKVIKTATEDCECQLKDVLTGSLKHVAEILTGIEIEQASFVKKNNPQVGKPEAADQRLPNLTSEEYIAFKNSGMSFDKWIEYNSLKKSPSTAFWLSFLLPAGGQYYNGDYGRGILQQVIMTGGILLAGIKGAENSETTGAKYIYIGVGIAVTGWVWSWLDARASAVDHNKKLAQQYGYLIEYKLNNAIVSFDIGLTKEKLGGQVTVHF